MRYLTVIFLLLSLSLNGQISEEGLPYTFTDTGIPSDAAIISLPVPDTGMVLMEDLRSGNKPQPYRIAVGIPADIDLSRDAQWQYTSDGRTYLQLTIEAKGASSLILYYNSFRIPEGGKLFIYNEDRSQLIGAFTSRNNPSGGYFATEMVSGDRLSLEYDAPGSEGEAPSVKIYEVHYVYKNVELWTDPSGPCEVNINCPEGDAWQNEKQSVAKVVLKAGVGTYLCSGALVNNVRQDSTPYFLTARHCGSSASLTDYSQWVFHFNYEAMNCEDPLENPDWSTISGSTFLAEAPDGPDNGSDFKLIELSQKLPEDYNPYFAGWNAAGLPSSSGVGIHHPKGAPKKISTYTLELQSTDFGQSGQNPDGMYWRVYWSETETAQGVTEGGSSGSPIFDNTGLIVGTLTGGVASCSDPNAPDFYGKFSSHWSSNGSTNDAQLKPFLDPDNTGAQSLEGFGYGSRLVANFIADTTVINTGGWVEFIDKSGGEPESWTWILSGGEPYLVSTQDPGRITYNDYGLFDAMLVVSNGISSDTLIRKEYIRVTPNLYPNPADESLTLDFGRREVEYIEVEVFDVYGRLARTYKNSSTTTGVWTISVGDLNAGTYIFRIKTNVMEDNMPVIIY